MKTVSLTALLLTLGICASAQINAITSKGEAVVLYEDGSWSYLDSLTKGGAGVLVNEKVYVKSKDANFLVESSRFKTGVWINPKEWRFEKAVNNKVAEYEFQKIGGDLYALMITEPHSVSMETLKANALENARLVSPNIKITKEEYRMVNGLKVYAMEMSGAIQRMDFTFLGYYYSNEEGTIQLQVYTGRNLFNENYQDIEQFLNGLVELE